MFPDLSSRLVMAAAVPGGVLLLYVVLQVGVPCLACVPSLTPCRCVERESECASLCVFWQLLSRRAEKLWAQRRLTHLSALCLALLNVMLLATAQTALGALGCTDHRCHSRFFSLVVSFECAFG